MKTLLVKLAILLTLPLFLILGSSKTGIDSFVPQESKVSNEIASKKLDNEAQILASYLSKFNSPMQYHAQDFIDASRTYDLNWMLLPSIAGVESTFGKHIPGGYNAYGWAIYNSSSRFGFKSWRDGMFVVAKGLREGYLNKGLTNPYSMNKIYATSPHWGKNVTFFMNDLEKFSKGYGVKTIESDIMLPQFKIAAVSGILDNDN